MLIRSATEKDIPAIVELLKLSLGESLMPKSEAFWRWKHVDNPFGKSPVLLAVENHQLIGVRAFMRWEWRKGDKVHRAVRAVDTATHPAHQGKGIFKKLTLQLVDQCRLEGVDFIFNTPNKSSKPGYLKMGWIEQGRLPINIRPLWPLRTRRSDFDAQYELTSTHEVFARLTYTFQSERLQTHYSNRFFIWRYTQNPNIRYYAIRAADHSYGIIFRLKPGKAGVEFRICDVIFSDLADISQLNKHLFQVVKESAASFLTIANADLLPWSFSLNIGPMVTVRSVALDNSLSFDFWKPSLGDMELF